MIIIEYLEPIRIEEMVSSLETPEATSSPWSRLGGSKQTDGDQKASCRHRHLPGAELRNTETSEQSYSTIFCYGGMLSAGGSLRL